MRSVRTDDAPAPVQGAPYSQGALVDPGRLLFVSGQIPINPDSGELVAGDITVQTRQAMANLLAVVVAGGGAGEDIVKTTIYLTDLGDFPAMNAAYAEALGGHAPARATVGVAALPLGARVEIEAVAVVATGPGRADP
jgi:2-iminobutanoate/2-iminopropanoate deaminase